MIRVALVLAVVSAVLAVACTEEDFNAHITWRPSADDLDVMIVPVDDAAPDAGDPDAGDGGGP